MIIDSIPINPRVCAYIQKCFYEYTGYEDVVKSVLRDSEFKYNKEMFLACMGEFQEKRKEYLLCMEEVKAQILPKKYRTHEFNMQVNFVNDSLDIYKMSDTNTCTTCKG